EAWRRGRPYGDVPPWCRRRAERGGEGQRSGIAPPAYGKQRHQRYEEIKRKRQKDKDRKRQKEKNEKEKSMNKNRFELWQILYPIAIYYVVMSLAYFGLEVILGATTAENYMVRQLLCGAI